MKKPSDFIKPGDYVIFPADDRGIRLIKIVPNVDSEFTLAYWLRMGAELFAGEVPKSGYIFEKIAENWAPEEVDDKVWEPKPMSHVPQKVKSLGDAMRDGDYQIGEYQITCVVCSITRETHARSAGRPSSRYAEQFCAQCQRITLHNIRKIEDVEVMIPPTTPTPSIQEITHIVDTGPEPLKGVHVYDYKKVTWIALLFLRLKEMWRKILG